MLPRLLASTVISVLFISTAQAQTHTQPSGPHPIEETMQEFVAQPVRGIELPKQTAAKFSTRIKTPPVGVTADTTGVRLNGYIRYVPHEGANYVQVVMTSLSRGNVEIPFSDRKAVHGQFRTGKLVLTTGDDLPLKARPEVLNDALKQLAEAGKKAGEKDIGEEPKSDKNAQPVARSGGSSKGQAGGGSSGTASKYQPPTNQQDYRRAKTEQKIVTDGCAVRIDTAQNVAIQQSKAVLYEEGKVKSSSACKDSSTRYALHKSGDGCPDIVDVSALTAWRQGRTYYNRNGERVTISDCAKDTSAPYSITGDASGCAPVVDRVARKVRVYAKLVYTGATNAQIQVRGCGRSTVTHDLQKSHDSCTDKIDLAAKLASGRFKDFYVNHKGTRAVVSDCTVDSDQQWPIREVEGNCKVFPDFTAGKERVYQQAVMNYTDDKGMVHEARGCARSTLTQPVRMRKTVANCTIRHDFDNKLSHQMDTWIYRLDGVTYRASACADTGVTYPHRNHTLDAGGGKVCTPTVDQNAKWVTLSYRTGISVRGRLRYITECTPDSGNRLNVVATTNGCTDPDDWRHDLASGISYDNQRWYYTLNGKREYVTPCQKGGKTYRHDVTTTDWQVHDDQLYAFPISKVTIATPIGNYVVSVNTVLPGATQQPYVYQSIEDKLNEAFAATPISHEGCSTAFLRTDRVKRYTRPDRSSYEVIVGVGKPRARRGSFCKRVRYGGIIETVSVVTSSIQRTCFSQGDAGNPGSTTTREDEIGYYKLVHTVTGEIIATNLKSVRSSSTSTVTGRACHHLG